MIQNATPADLTPDVRLLLTAIRAMSLCCGCSPTKELTTERAARYEALNDAFGIGDLA